MTYAIVGTGNMAWFLASRLHLAGFQCKGVYGRNKNEATLLAGSLNAPVLYNLNHIRDGNMDCCILAVSDNAIPEVASRLALRETVIIHTAGAVALDAIPQEHSAAMWCIYSILKHKLPETRQIPVICEAANNRALQVVTEIATAVTDIVQHVTWEQRQFLHLAAVFGNNFTNHLLAICSRLCTERNIPFELLHPIILQTFQRINEGNPDQMQTGPAKRNDVNTMHRHALLLNQHPAWKDVYQSISASIGSMYYDAGENK